MLLQEFLSRKKVSRKKLSIFVSKVGPATGVTGKPIPAKFEEILSWTKYLYSVISVIKKTTWQN